MSVFLPLVERLGFVDVDGVVISSLDRDNYATQIASALVDPLEAYLDAKQLESVRKSVFYHENVFWNRDVMMGDILFGGSVLPDLAKFGNRHDLTILLTSRPEETRLVTLQRLSELGVDMGKYYLVPKPPAAKFTPTTPWKASTVDTFSMFFCAKEVDVVDNEKSILDEVQKHHDDTRFSVKCYLSLASFISGEKHF